jgi:energy-coupling factor transporter ATP-binding protein EcfA2
MKADGERRRWAITANESDGEQQRLVIAAVFRRRVPG